MRRVCAACFVLVTLVVLAPSVASAQATITGIVKDASGAVLPGVTVEAASPDLIEKVRSATTDSDGQYRITGLRGGTYSVTFSLQGFLHRAPGRDHAGRGLRGEHQRRTEGRLGAGNGQHHR